MSCNYLVEAGHNPQNLEVTQLICNPDDIPEIIIGFIAAFFGPFCQLIIDRLLNKNIHMAEIFSPSQDRNLNSIEIIEIVFHS